MKKKPSSRKVTAPKVAKKASKVLKNSSTGKASKSGQEVLYLKKQEMEMVQENLKSSIMKLSEYKEYYYSFTGKLSDINRQIAFAGIAIILIFKQSNGTEITIENTLLLPAILIVLSLGFDMLQYIYQSIVWASLYSYYKKNGNSEDGIIESSVDWNNPSWFLYTIKILLVVIAYWKIFEYLIDKFI